MDACWFLEMFAEIAKGFSHDRHPRLRKRRSSVPQVSPRSKSDRALVCDGALICVQTNC